MSNICWFYLFICVYMYNTVNGVFLNYSLFSVIISAEGLGAEGSFTVGGGPLGGRGLRR